MWTTQKNRIKQQQRTKAITCHQTQFKVLYHFGIRCKYAPSPCLNKSSMLSKCFCTSSSGLGKKAKSDCKHLKGKANTRKLLDFLLTQTIGVTTWNLICPNSFRSFLTWLPFNRTLLHSCQLPNHHFLLKRRARAGPTSYEKLRRASRFLSIANGQQIPPPWVCESPPKHTWFGSRNIFGTTCVALKLSRKDVWHTDPVYMRMFVSPCATEKHVQNTLTSVL